ADLHYSSSKNEIDLEQIVEHIVSDNPDYVMFVEISFMKKHQRMKKKKVFYVYGNHDLGKYSIHNKGTVEEITSLIESNGIYMLNDEITLIGRSDYSLHDRKEMSSYELNNSTYNIVLDHQPRELEKCSNNNADLYLSGYTHAGQIFPLYYDYEFLNINELNYGLETVNQMNAINTSGISG
ncbi:MAG: metallophosphoesterase, partial [Thomasclavelia spiroformis]